MFASPNRVMALAFGVAYLALGVFGFTATTAVGFVATVGGPFLGILEVNPLQNVIHLVIGAVLVAASLRSIVVASTTNAMVGALLLVFGLASLFLVGTALNIVAVSVADNVLHFGSAAVLLAVGLGADRRAGA